MWTDTFWLRFPSLLPSAVQHVAFSLSLLQVTHVKMASCPPWCVPPCPRSRPRWAWSSFSRFHWIQPLPSAFSQDSTRWVSGVSCDLLAGPPDDLIEGHSDGQQCFYVGNEWFGFPTFFSPHILRIIFLLFLISTWILKIFIIFILLIFREWYYLNAELMLLF